MTQPAHRTAARAWLNRHYVGVWGTTAVLSISTAIAGLTALITGY